MCTSGVLAALVQYACFEGVPHVTDATSHLFQARIFAEGQLAAPLPPCYESFHQHNVVMNPNGTWHTKYFPGQALWLAPGVAIGLDGLMMPLGWLLCVWAFMRLVERLHDKRLALGAGALLALSPMGLLLAGSFMSHTTFLMFSLLAGAALVEAWSRRDRAARPWFLAGLFAGLALITRPQDMVAWLGPMLALACLHPRTAAQRIGRGLPWATLGVAIPLGGLLLWNMAHYGALTSGGYNFSRSISLTPIIQDSLGFGDRHTPRVALYFTLQTLWRFNQALFGWPLSFLFIPLAFFSDRKAWNVAALLSCAAVVLLYALFPYQGLEYEARYFTPALPFLAYLTARGTRTALAMTRNTNRWHGLPELLLAAFIAHSAFFYVPSHIWPKYSKDYEQVSRVLETSASVSGLSNAVVLVPSDYPHDFRYSSGFILNDPWLRNDIIYARDRAHAYGCLADAFPTRSLHRFVPDEDWRKGRFEPVPLGQSPSR
ncbi:MAG TPA: glycosyltransferase family 39 protein [Kiritimatiellia bacterium]|nr:glycosyltransferase family 39 protein [Kiritimatiellia bacterium]